VSVLNSIIRPIVYELINRREAEEGEIARRFNKCLGYPLRFLCLLCALRLILDIFFQNSSFNPN
jgi:hypothetical protein